MKRVRAACLYQTLHFLPKEDVDHATAVETVKAEVAHYKAQLERNQTAFKIDEETVLEDGSVLIRIRKQYNTVRVGEYLD